MIGIIKKFNIIEKLILILTMIIVIGLPMLKIINFTYFHSDVINNFHQIKYARFLWNTIPFLIVLYMLNTIFIKKRITYADIIIYLLIVLSSLSTVFAVNMNVSIYGSYLRYEGLLTLLAYYLILLNVKDIVNKKYKGIILKSVIIIGIVQIIYGIFQVYTNSDIVVHFSIPYMASGLSGNPNFFGSYMVILTSFTFAMYMLEQSRKYLILSLIFFMGLCLASSTGPFISFCLIVIFFIIFYQKKIKWKALFKVLLLFVLVYFFVDISVKFVHTNIFENKIDENYNISSELIKLDLSNLGNGRITLWKTSLPLVKKYWAFGAGLDNFGIIYGERNNLNFDKAHNVYLQILLTNGVFALIIYLILMLVIFFKGLKIKDKVYISILMAFMGYSIQAFANISVIEVAPIFYIICGLLLGRILNGEPIIQENKNGL